MDENTEAPGLVVTNVTLRVDPDGCMSGVIKVGPTYYRIQGIYPIVQLPDDTERLSLLGHPEAQRRLNEARYDGLIGNKIARSEAERIVVDAFLQRLAGAAADAPLEAITFGEFRASAIRTLAEVGEGSHGDPALVFRVDDLVVSIWDTVKLLIKLTSE